MTPRKPTPAAPRARSKPVHHPASYYVRLSLPAVTALLMLILTGISSWALLQLVDLGRVVGITASTVASHEEQFKTIASEHNDEVKGFEQLSNTTVRLSTTLDALDKTLQNQATLNDATRTERNNRFDKIQATNDALRQSLDKLTARLEADEAARQRGPK